MYHIENYIYKLVLLSLATFDFLISTVELLVVNNTTGFKIIISLSILLGMHDGGLNYSQVSAGINY